MAEGTSLKLKFDTMSGSKTWTFASAKASTTKAQVTNLASVMIENSDLFDARPVLLRDARLVTTTENVYDLDS